jgi:hypothetical protein
MTKSSLAVMMVSSAWLGGAPIAGGNGGVVRPGFGIGEELEQGGRKRARVRQQAFIWRQDMPRHDAE